MNEFTQPVGQAELDRMVDGELTDEQQRSLLSRMDETPDGWKRLALSYVEGQLWSATLSQTVPTASPVVAVGEVENHTPSQSPFRFVAAFRFVVAAAVLLAVGFGLGVFARPDAAVDTGTSERVAGDSPQSDTFPTDDSVHVVSHDGTSGQPSESHVPASPVNPSVVQLIVHDDHSDAPRVVSVPIRDESVPLDEVFANEQSTVPDHVRAMLQETGHEIHEESGFWPLALPDGRQVIIPVNQVRVRDSARIYQ